MKRAAAAFALLLAAVVALGAPALMQDRLLYFPARATVAQMQAGGLLAWPSADEFRGLVAEPAGPVRGTAIVFHGNAGHAGHRDAYVAALRPSGLRVILAEYPGYGPRDGALGEASLVADAVESISLAHRQHGAPLLVIGESLGAGVAAAAAARQREAVAGLMLITPWDKLQNIASHHYPWLPVKWLLRDQYDSAAHLAAFGAPVLVVVAERDDIVPAAYGQALYQGLGMPKELRTLPGAGHNDWWTVVDAGWWQARVDWLLESVPR
jgi:alpha-beta hydrolase superfamily lysophospholipase